MYDIIFIAMTWSWEDSKRKKRHYYSVQSVLDLDDNLDSDSLDVFSEGKQYTVDVRSMKHSKTLKMYREVAGEITSSLVYSI